MFEIIAGIAMLLAAFTIWALNRRLGDAEYRAGEAEQAAASAWSNAYQAATTEINARRDNESRTTYGKAFEEGWNGCIDEYETRQELTQARAA